jgi:hypothetical protein
MLALFLVMFSSLTLSTPQKQPPESLETVTVIQDTTRYQLGKIGFIVTKIPGENSYEHKHAIKSYDDFDTLQLPPTLRILESPRHVTVHLLPSGFALLEITEGDRVDLEWLQKVGRRWAIVGSLKGYDGRFDPGLIRLLWFWGNKVKALVTDGNSNFYGHSHICLVPERMVIWDTSSGQLKVIRSEERDQEVRVIDRFIEHARKTTRPNRYQRIIKQQFQEGGIIDGWDTKDLPKGGLLVNFGYFLLFKLKPVGHSYQVVWVQYKPNLSDTWKN